jgi:thermitase
MRREFVSIIMLTLILTSMFGTAFVVGSSPAKGIGSGQTLTNPLGRVGGTVSQNGMAGQDLVQGNANLGLSQENQTGREVGNAWNFSDTNAWANFTYMDGNKTRLIVGIDSSRQSDVIDLTRIAVEHHASVVNRVMMGGKVRALVVELQMCSVTAFVGQVQSMSLASYVEPNVKIQALFSPNDPQWNLQWGPQKIQADWAWNTTMGNKSVLVAVVDTGIDYNHPDLAANYVPLGFNWVSDNSDPKDDFGHGTHCAGIIAAVSNNGVGIAGMAQVRIMAEKVLDSMGGGTVDWVASGIAHAVDQGANVISLSLGDTMDSELLHEAVRYAYDAGVLVVASAGNENSDVKMYPAAYDEVVAVAATDQADLKASFSEYGDWIELAAPGVYIYSTMPTYHVTLNDFGYAMNYDYLSGTSMACPHVSGLAALTWSQYMNKTRDWLRLWLRYTADDLGDPGFDTYYGYGRINARRAMEQLPPAHELVLSGWTTPPYVPPGTTGTLNVTVINFGENDETNVVVQLLANDSLANSTSIGFLSSGVSYTTSLSWNPSAEGFYNVTVYVKPVAGETNLGNNVASKYIFVGSPVKAFVLHSAGNVDPDIITNWQFLNTEWQSLGNKMVYVDYTTLNKDNITYEDIAKTAADVLIISCAYDPEAGWQFTDSEVEAITRYVHEGHGLIATAGTFYRAVPNNNKLAPLFGMNDTITWDETATDLLEPVDSTHPIFNKVPNPLVFPRVGTAIPWSGQWDSNVLAGGTYLAFGHFKESALVAYRGLIYISPWLEVIPPYYHHHLQLLYNAITWSQYQKPQHQVAVSLEGAQHLNPDESTFLNVTVYNGGLNNETNVELQLLIDNVKVDSTTISKLSVGSSYTLIYPWTPTVKGRYNVTAYAPPVLGEEIIQDNVAEKTVLVLSIAAKNVLVYSDDYPVNPSSRYVIVALDELGINYTYYADDPAGFGSALTNKPWDLVIVDHCNLYALGDHFNEIDDYVRNGGRLILSTFAIDGSYSAPTSLWDTLGVQYVSEMPTAEPVYEWTPSDPLFTFPNKVSDLHSYVEGYYDHGDHVANTTSTAVAGFTNSFANGYAGIVVGNNYPTVLFSFILDEFRYDQNDNGRPDAVDLWENAIVHLAEGHEHDVAVTLSAPSFLSPNDSALISATIRNLGLSDETGVDLQLLINDAIMNSTTIPALQPGSSSMLSYLWTPTTEAAYNVTAYAPPVLDEDVTTNNIATKIVIVSTAIKVAVLGDYNSQLTSLLLNNSILATERDWSVIENIYEYDAVIINKPDDPGQTAFLDLINAADKYRVGLVFTSSWPAGTGIDWPYGITLLHNYLGDPGVQASTYGAGSVYYQVVKEHPIFEGWNVGDTIYAITTGDRDHSWFWSYSGETIANIGNEYSGITGEGIAYKIRENGNKHLLLAGLAPQYYANTEHWTEEAKLIFVRGVRWASRPVVYEHDLDVGLAASASLKRGDSTLLNYTVRNGGLSNETAVTLSLLINGSIVDSTMIPALSEGESYAASYLWMPTLVGEYNITVYAPPLAEEENVANNNVTLWSSVLGIHDVAVTNVKPISHDVAAGSPVNVSIDVENLGDYNESFEVTVHATPPEEPTVAAQLVSNSTRVYLDPSAYVFDPKAVSVGYRFNVTVKVASVEDLYAWQAKLCYNNSMINATRWFEPTWDPEYVFYGEQTVNAEDFETDYIMTFAGLLGQKQPLFNGTGKLCIIEFEIVSIPSPGTGYSCPLGINNEGTFLLNMDIQKIPTVKEDGTFGLGQSLQYDIGTIKVTNLGSGEKRSLTIVCDTTSMQPGNYEISAIADGITGETNIENNKFTDGIVSVQSHDVAVVDVTPSRRWIFQGSSVNINVTIENKGSHAENVTVILYYNLTANKIIGVQVISLLPSENQSVIYTWNTTGVQYCHNYTITAVASIPFDSNPSDNTLVDGGIKVRILGDLNGDGVVDGSDLAIVAWSFGSFLNHSRWNADADINGDGVIDGSDLVVAARSFGTCAA